MAMESPDLENPIQEKDKASLLEDAVAKISVEINQLMERNFGMKGFVQPDGRIDMEKYMQRRSISKASFDRDMGYIQGREKAFSQDGKFAKENSARENPREVSQEELVNIWKKESRENSGSQMELLAMAMFHKFFSQDFMVVRASTFDDYKNGIDMILVNRKTGAVICAFDDVIGHQGSHHLDRKNETIQEIIGGDGATLRYGFQIRGRHGKPEIEEKELAHLPIFCLQFSPQEFCEMFQSLDSDPKGKPSDKEIEMMKKILAGLESQCQKLLALGPIPQVRENIKLSIASIAQMNKAAEGLN